VIVYEHANNHRGRIHVLFTDGEIQYLSLNEAKALVPDLVLPADQPLHR
jgi:hypothetical protein